MTLVEQAGAYADAAENARLAGDIVASLALAIHAAQLLKLARLLDHPHQQDQHQPPE
jgi:hypothetical protein